MIYLDMDGVLMDFDRGLKEAGFFVWHEQPGNRMYHHMPKDQWTPDELTHDRQIQNLMRRPEFWHGLQPMPDAFLLWEHCAPWGHHILTAAPSAAGGLEMARTNKWGSIGRHFDPHFSPSRFNCCLRSEKQQFAANGSILVDDMPANCEEWTAAGGTAILHKDAISTIKILKELGYSYV